MDNETTRIDKVLRILEDVLEERGCTNQGLNLLEHQRNSLREVYLNVEVMRQQSLYRTLDRKLKLVDKLNRSYKKRLETVDADFAANVEAWTE